MSIDSRGEYDDCNLSQRKWKAEVDVEELASGKFQGVVLLFHEDGPAYEQQILHKTVTASDTVDCALAEAKVLAHHLLGNL